MPPDDLRLALLLWDLAPWFTVREFRDRCLLDELEPNRFESIVEAKLVEYKPERNFGMLPMDLSAKYELTPAGHAFVMERLPDPVRRSIKKKEWVQGSGIALVTPLAIGCLTLPFVLRHTIGKLSIGEPASDAAALLALVYLSKLALTLQSRTNPWARRKA